MNQSEMEVVLPSDVLKYTGHSSGGLLRNKTYTIKERKGGYFELYMPKGQRISIDVNDHDLWEMHDQKGAAEAKKRHIRVITDEFYSSMDISFEIEELNTRADQIEQIMKDFPLDAKMKLLGKLSKETMDLLEVFHKFSKNKLTTEKLVKAFKKKEKL